MYIDNYIICKYYLNKINVNNMDGTTLFLGHFGMGRFAPGPFSYGPFLHVGHFGMGRFRLG